MTAPVNQQPAVEPLDRGSDLADVVETVLDKGVVIDAQVQVAALGIQLLEINARIVIASVETYLRFAEAVDRLDITPKNQKTLPDVVEEVTSGTGQSLGQGARQLFGAVGDLTGDVGRAVDDRDSDRATDRDGKDRRRSPRSRSEKE